MGTVLKETKSRLKSWFQEFLDKQFTDGVRDGDPLRAWFDGCLEDLEIVVDSAESKIPSFPSRSVLHAVLTAKKGELVDGPLQEFLKEAEGYGSLKAAAMVLMIESEKLNRKVPVEVMQWEDIARVVFRAAQFFEKTSEPWEAIRGWGIKGGPDPFSHKNFLIYLVWRNIKQAIDQNQYELVADFVGASGYPAISPEAVAKRIRRFEETLKRLLAEVTEHRP